MAKQTYKAKLIPVEIEGLSEVLANLNKELKKVKTGCKKGMLTAVAEIRRDTERTYPKTPVDIGNLRASWFTVSADGIEPDPLGVSGQFKNRPFKKMQIKASDMSGQHSAVVSSAQADAISESKSNKEVVIFGYSASYAFFVHEMIYAENWSRDESGPKWLEYSLKRNSNLIIDIVKNNAKIP
jgi:hypothetical protein